MTATPASILDTQTSQLAVDASDPDNGPSPLSYNWIVPVGAGSVSDSAIANPIYTPADVATTQIVTLTVEVSDGSATVSSTVDVTVNDTPVVNIPPVINSVTATPASILDTQTSQLAVDASDADNGPSPLSYNWIVPRSGRAVVTTRHLPIRFTLGGLLRHPDCHPELWESVWMARPPSAVPVDVTVIRWPDLFSGL